MAADPRLMALIDALLALFNRKSMDLPDGLFDRRTQFLLNGTPFEAMLGRSPSDPLVLMIARGPAGYRFAMKAVQHAVPDARVERGDVGTQQDSSRDRTGPGSAERSDGTSVPSSGPGPAERSDGTSVPSSGPGPAERSDGTSVPSSGPGSAERSDGTSVHSSGAGSAEWSDGTSVPSSEITVQAAALTVPLWLSGHLRGTNAPVEVVVSATLRTDSSGVVTQADVSLDPGTLDRLREARLRE